MRAASWGRFRWRSASVSGAWFALAIIAADPALGQNSWESALLGKDPEPVRLTSQGIAAR